MKERQEEASPLTRRSNSMSGAATALRAKEPTSNSSKLGIKPTNELYFQHKPLLNRLVRRFQNRYGGFLPDLLSEADEFFLIACKDWDGERDFKVWVKFVVWHTMLQQARNRAVRNATLRREYPDLAFIRSKPSFKVAQLLKEVSEDAATLIQLALVPRRNIKNESPLKRREDLVAFLLNQGWEESRVSRAVREVREALS